MKNMRRIQIILTAVLIILAGQSAAAQSRDFKLGQWTEIHNGIIKELSRSYVDTLPVDKMMRKGVDAMLEQLDPYTIYIPEEENEDLQMLLSKTYGGIGAIIHKKKEENVVINEPYFGSPAHKNGLMCGDEIIAIDGLPTKGLESKESSDRMKGKPGTTVVFTVKKVRTGDTLDIPIVRERIHLPDIEYAGMLNDTTGYILQSGFTEGVSQQLKDRFLELKSKGMKQLVLDLRGNGGGLMSEAVNIISLFVPKGSLAVSSKGKAPGSSHEYRTQTDPIDTQTPIIVMIDGGSASASEIVSGGLQDLKRAVIKGKTSYGKGLVQSIRPLPYNGQMKVTTAKYYTPSGRCVQGIGVKPDVEIDVPSYSRLVYSLVLGGVIDQYVMQFARSHESIPEVDIYHFGDEDFEDFIKFAKTQDFDYRSSAKATFDKMKEELKEDGLEEVMAEELAALEKALEMDKERFIRLKKDEIIPFIEEEIATRYWFQEAGVKIRLRYDDQLKKAL
jgi:carboxyl-terminal processing protease